MGAASSDSTDPAGTSGGSHSTRPSGRNLAVVTGGSGYVGVNLVPQLRDDGYSVRVLDRELHPLLRPLDVDFVSADICDPAAVRAGLAGADVVFHLAALISVTGDMGGLVERVNVAGVANVAAAARRAGVRRFVHCSSVHAFDTDVPGPIDETSPKAVRPELPGYDRSKAAGERALLREVEQGLDAVIVNPTGIIGPRDPRPSRTGRMLAAMRRGTVPAVVEGGFDWVDVRDVVAGLLAAQRLGRTGQNYLLAGHRASLRELADLVAAVSAGRSTPFTLPLWFARIWSPLAGVLARWSDNPLLYTSDTLHAVGSFPQIDDRRARTELGHQPRPLEQTVGDLFDWFDSQTRAARYARG